MSRVHLVLAALVIALAGVLVGLKLTEDQWRDRGPAEASGEPALATPPLAPPDQQATAEAAEPAEPSETLEAELAGLAEDDGVEDSAATGESAEAEKAEVASKTSAPDRSPRAKRRRARSRRAERLEPATPVKVEKSSPRKVDGVVIASDPGDDPAPKDSSKRSEKPPSRVGKTPIAEGFDE